MYFLIENWEVILALVVAIGWVLVRLMPTGRNRDIVEKILTFLSRLVPNNSNEVDDEGNKLSHSDLRFRKRRYIKKDKKDSEN